MSWTDERVELLSQLWLEGRSASQISAVLGAGLTRNAVIGKVHRLGLAGRVKPVASPGAAPQLATSHSAGNDATRRAPARANPVSANIMTSTPVVAVATQRIVQGNTVMRLALEPVEIAALPARIPQQDVVVPMSLRVTIVELRETMCRWPLGDPASSEFRYCGSPSSSGTPYCTHHGKLAYQPTQDRRRERDRRPLLAR